ncbi:MAG: diacylglycerol kinase [bacterium]|nr:diacylglycerol kinase [bacterium]
MISFTTLKNSARFARHGLFIVWREEQNFRVEIVAAILAIICGVLLSFTVIELSIVSLLIGCILAMECANSALERLLDIIKPRVSEYVRSIKDIIAAMMLILVITSLLVTIFLYIPKLINLFTIVI